MLRGAGATGGTLIDVGAGSGVGADEAIRLAPPDRYRRVVLLDPQVGMLARARRHGRGPPRCELVAGDAARLPLAPGCADVLLSLGVLCCVTRAAIPSVVEESWRVLRPGGRIVVAVPRWRGDQDTATFLARGFRKLAGPRPGWSLYERPAGTAPKEATAPVTPA